MTEDEKRAAEDKARKDEDARRADAEAGEKLDKILKGIDTLCDRMDSAEKRMDAMDDAHRKDADEKDAARKDAARKDAEKSESEEEKEKEEKAADAKRKDGAEPKDKKEEAERLAADKARKDDAATADSEDIRKRIADIERMLPKERSDADLRVMTEAQANADTVYRAFGKAAPRFLNGEDEMSYRRRLVREFQSHSPTWKPVDLAVINDSTAFAVAEKTIYADAMAAAMDSRGVEDGGLRMVKGETASGHRETKFYGRPSAWMGRFAGAKRYVKRLNPVVKEIN